MKPEKRLEQVFRASAALTYGSRHFFRKTHGDMFTGAGTPDFVGHIFGLHTELELKVYQGVFSQAQKNNIMEVSRTGGFTGGIFQYEDLYYYLNPDQVNGFTLRDRRNWTPLPMNRVATREGLEPRLNLMPLTIMVTLYIEQMRAVKHFQPVGV